MIVNKPAERLNPANIQKENEKDKVKKAVPVRKSIDHPEKEAATSNGFVIEEVAEKISESGKNLISKSRKMKPELAKNKSLTKATEKLTQKKSIATMPLQKQKMKAKKTNTKSSLLSKGGITKKVVKPQRNKASSSAYPKKPSISDERLRAFGLNPKKFHNKLKYGGKSTASGPTSSKAVVPKTKNNKLEKLNQKKIKKKLMQVLGN